VRIDYVDFQNLVVLLVEHNLDEFFRFFGDSRVREDVEFERIRFHVVVVRLRFLLGEIDVADFRIVVRVVGNLVVIDVIVFPAGDALC